MTGRGAPFAEVPAAKTVARIGPSGIVLVQERLGEAVFLVGAETVLKIGSYGRTDTLHFGVNETPALVFVRVLVGDEVDAGLYTVTAMLARWPAVLPDDWAAALWRDRSEAKL